jgi:rhamnogalacturonyl hydrolase YesR
MIKKSIPICCILLALQLNLPAQDIFTRYAPGSSPQEIGLKLATRFLHSPHGQYGYNAKPHIPYFEVCTWYGALSFARETKNDTLRTKLIDRFNPLWDTDTALLPFPDHVDYNVFGAVPLEIYLQTKERKYLENGKMYADTQWVPPFGPRVVPESYTYFNAGYTWQTRLWIDDMYMITMLQSQAYRATNDNKYLDRTAKEMALYLDSLQKPNGLFYHAPASPFYWGRGNGWMAAGMTELLRVLPKNNFYYKKIMAGYKSMMQSLLQFQSENGMWRQLINDTASWYETSCTGMFAYAFITGVKNNWLDKKKYGNAAKKAWLALIKYINDDGDITDVCEGTGAGNSREYYLTRKRRTGDFHGQAPVLWCTAALLRKKEIVLR